MRQVTLTVIVEAPATMAASMAMLAVVMLDFRFDNAFVHDLPGDTETGPRVRQVESALWSRVEPTPVAAPRLLAYSPEMAKVLGLGEADVLSPEFAQVFGGNALLAGMEPDAAN